MQKLIAYRANNATRYLFTEEFIEDLKVVYETQGREKVTEKLQSLMSNVLSALDLHFGSLDEKAKRKIYYKWVEELEKYMKDKPLEIDDDNDYDMRPEDIYLSYYPQAYKEFVVINPRPDFT